MTISKILGWLVIFTTLTGFLLMAASAHAETASGDVVGKIQYYTVQPEDTLYAVARRFDIGIVDIMAANPGVDLWVPDPGTVLTLPTMYVLPPVKHEGIVINLSELRLFYFPDPHTVVTFPIGIGRDGWETPVGTTTIVEKRKNPIWTPPDSIRADNPDLPNFIPAGPDNPLGDYAMNLGWSGYLLHGTNRPYGIGRRSSHGCIRLYPEDIEKLFNAVKEGTVVTVIDSPYKLGWRKNTLFLEITPTQIQTDSIAEHKPLDIQDIPKLYGDIRQLAGTAQIDWRAVRDAVMWRNSIPIAIAYRENIASQ